MRSLAFWKVLWRLYSIKLSTGRKPPYTKCSNGMLNLAYIIFSDQSLSLQKISDFDLWAVIIQVEIGLNPKKR